MNENDRSTHNQEEEGKGQKNSFNKTFLTFLMVLFFTGIGVFLVQYNRKSRTSSPDEQATGNQQTNQENEKGSSDKLLRMGKQVYRKNCQSCHGKNGKGNGPASVYLYPKPRDFTSGVFKFTSTPGGELPTDKDLKHTIKNGISGSGMASFGSVLSDREVEAVVEYIKTFSSRYEKSSPGKPIDVSEPVPSSPDLVKRGKELFQKNACWTCHGQEGKGDGPSAKQKDRWGNPIRPRDLTQGVYKWAEKPEDLYKIIMTGINGTGMGGYATSIQDRKDRWAIVRYVQSLSDGGNGKNFLKLTRTEETTFEQGTIPDGPASDAWSKLNTTTLEVFPLWKRPIAPPRLHVTGVYNDEKIAVRLRWRDSSQNLQDLKHRSFTDAAAMQYPASPSKAPPFFAMGNDDELVRIWHWKAVREEGKHREKPVDLESVYTRIFADRYPWMKKQKPSEMLDPNKGETNLKKQDPSYQSAVDSGNPLSDPKLTNRSVLEYIAEGFGTLTAVPRKQLSVNGNAVWKEGEWKVMFTRSRQTDAESDRTFKSGESIWLGFAIFDGKYDERNGKKSVSQWVKVHLK